MLRDPQVCISLSNNENIFLENMIAARKLKTKSAAMRYILNTFIEEPGRRLSVVLTSEQYVQVHQMAKKENSSDDYVIQRLINRGLFLEQNEPPLAKNVVEPGKKPAVPGMDNQRFFALAEKDDWSSNVETSIQAAVDAAIKIVEIEELDDQDFIITKAVADVNIKRKAVAEVKILEEK